MPPHSAELARRPPAVASCLRRPRLFSVTLALGMLAAAPPPALSQRAAEDEQSRSAPTIGATTGRILNEAIESLNMDDLAGARAALAQLRLDRLSPFERSRVEQILFGIEYAEEDYAAARRHLNEAIAAGGFNADEARQARFQIAQIFMIEEKWSEGAAALEDWFETAENPNSAAYYLLAAAYYQLQDPDRALPPARKAVDLAERPQSSWVELLVALHLQREDYEQAIPLLELMIDMEPADKSNWLRLSSLYQQVEAYDEALAAMQVAYNAGYFTQDSDYQRLADMLRFNDVPYRAAQVLEEALAAGAVTADAQVYEKLASCWIQAREFDRSIAPLQRAAELAENGEQFVRLGQVHVQREDWAEAATALARGIEKGGLADAGNAHLLMGIALYNQAQPREAREWFERAARSGEHRDMASTYMRLIDSEAE